ncbi:MAG: Bacteriophage head to tail connecting protein [Syntrophaceae bacterium PtaU1.Bin231]|nr:MAG: Bacteriophage head to tail connecting protein [Syntrophaceae bacterium PtaU1.Bin231]
MSAEIKQAYVKNENTRTFDIIHAVYPRDDYDWSKRDSINMKYASVYLVKDSKHVLSEGGYSEFPYAVPRWDKADGETTGRSPGMNALPDVKQLQQVVYDTTVAHQMWLRPPVLASKESALSTNHFTPGKIVYHRTGERPEPWPISGDLRVSLEEKNSLREAIRRSFFNDLFIVLSDNVPGRTAFEVRQMVEEKMNILGPFLGRLMVELLDVMLARAFWVLYRNGYIVPVPRELINQGLNVEYVGRLALAMRRYETSATAEALQLTQSIAQADQSVLDNWNMDEIVTGTAQRAGVPVKYLRPASERDKMRQARMEQMLAQQQAMEAQAMAQQVPSLSKAPEEGSPVDALIKAAGGGK